MSGPVSIIEAIEIGAPRARVFAVANGADPAAIFQKHRGLPGVREINGHQAPWSRAGQVRTISLTDGGALKEALSDYIDGERFAYVATEFSGAFGRLVTSARGEWRFDALGDARTRATWRYVFHPRSRLAAPLVWFIAKALWPGYMRAALARIKTLAE